MKTANQMYAYCENNKMGGTFSNRRLLMRNFRIIEKGLLDNEEIVMCFVGQLEIAYGQIFCACAISNQRIMIAHKKLIGEVLQTIAIDNVNDITVNLGIANGRLVIDTFKETVPILVLRNRAKRIGEILHNVIQNVKEERNERASQHTIVKQQESGADELLKYKQLLDEGIISNDEFDAKKKQILGL